MDNTNSFINFTSLFETIYTKEDLLLFYKQVDQLIALLFTGSGSLEEKMDQLISTDKKKSLMVYLKETNTRTNNLVEVKEKLSEIETIGNNLPMVTVELAFEPTEAIIKTISMWFMRRLNAKVILDFKLERSIIGGAYISYNGTYRDYTLQTKINNYFPKTN